MKYINKGTKTYQSTTAAEAAAAPNRLQRLMPTKPHRHTHNYTGARDLHVPIVPLPFFPSCICLLIDAAWADSKPNSDHTLQSLQLNLAVAQQKRPYIFYLAVAMPPAHHVCVCVCVCSSGHHLFSHW